MVRLYMRFHRTMRLFRGIKARLIRCPKVVPTLRLYFLALQSRLVTVFVLKQYSHISTVLNKIAYRSLPSAPRSVERRIRLGKIWGKC